MSHHIRIEPRRSPRTLLLGALRASAAMSILAACSSSVEPTATSEPTATASITLQAVSATQLTGTVGVEVQPVPTVLATDAAGAPIAGAKLSVEIANGAGAVRETRLVTDANGRARITWTLGLMTGVDTIIVRAPGSAPVTFTAVASPGILRFIRVQGGGQIARPGATLAEPLAATLEDMFGNPIPGATVAFSPISDGTIEESRAVSDDAGLARAGRWTLGPAVGIQRLRVRSGVTEVIAEAMSYVCSDPVPGSCASPLELAFARLSDGQIYRVRSDLSALIRLTRDGVNHDPAWSPDGRRIAFIHVDEGTRWQDEVRVMNADGSNVVRLSPDVRRGANAAFQSVAWSPDGTRLAVSIQGTDDEGSQFSSISIIDANGGGAVGPAYAGRRPVWSPDGRRIAFLRPTDYGGPGGVWVMNADGSGQRQIASPGDDIFGQIAWSPDGLAVVFTHEGRVYVANADGSGRREVVSQGSMQGADWSRDGRWLAVTLAEEDQPTMAIGFVPIEGGAPTVLLPDAYGPSWRP